MKKIRSILVVLLAAFISVSAMSQESKKKVEKITYKTSIHCEDCVNTVMSSLPLEKGVKDVECDLESKEVTVTIKTNKTDAEKVKRLFEKLGYTAVEINDKGKEDNTSNEK